MTDETTTSGAEAADTSAAETAAVNEAETAAVDPVETLKAENADLRDKFLRLAAEIRLGDVGLDDEAFEARIARRQLELTCRLFLNVRLEHDAIGR